jgi:hypothetical protein
VNNRTLAAEKRKTQAAPVQYWTTITGSIHRGPPTVGGLLKAVLFIRFQWRPTMTAKRRIPEWVQVTAWLVLGLLAWLDFVGLL